MLKCCMHLAETRKIIRRMGVIFSRFTGELRQGRSERGARDTRNGGIHVSRAPRPLCSSFARKTQKKKGEEEEEERLFCRLIAKRDS